MIDTGAGTLSILVQYRCDTRARVWKPRLCRDVKVTEKGLGWRGVGLESGCECGSGKARAGVVNV